MKNGEFIIMNKFILALVFVAAVSASGNFVEFLNDLHVGQQCQNNINTYTVTAFTVTPFPPARGDNVVSVSTGKFTQAETITGIKITVLLNNRAFYHETIPQSGSFTAGQVGVFTYSQVVASVSPPGSYTIQGGLINSQSQQINCWEVAFTLA